MKVRGTFRFDASRERVFAAVCDPQTLLAVIPGCDQVERVTDDCYIGRIALRLPGAVGSYRTEVDLFDVRVPEHARMHGRVDGIMGSIAGEARFDLVERGSQTILDYDGTAAIDGPLARLDSRFAERFAESLIAQGLRALDAHLVAEVVA